MPVIKFSHYNLRAPAEMMETLRKFYCDVVGLSVGPRAPLSSRGYWLYAGEQAALHLSESPSDCMLSSEGIGCFDHAAFDCEGWAEHESKLNQAGVKFRMLQREAVGPIQVFFKDPAGNGVELGFACENS